MSTDRAPFAFVEGALDRADHLRDAPDALAGLWPQARVVLLDDDGHALADAAQQLYVAIGSDLDGSNIGDVQASAIFLGLHQGRGWFAARAAMVDLGAPQYCELQRVDLRTAAGLWPAFDATVFAQARAVLHWHARHRYCGICGGDLDFVRAGWVGRCRQCGGEHYPRTDQAIIAAVTDGTRLLLGRQSSWPLQRYSVIAGFVEPGESLEQTVAREVLEEAGVRVRNCRYLASQPWPFPGSLMLGFLAEAEPDAAVAGDELEDVQWFGVDEVRAGLARDWRMPATAGSATAGSATAGPIPADAPGIVLSPPISIARWLIEQWLAEYGRGAG